MSKIGDLFYEVTYNIDNNGLKRVEKDIDDIGKSAKGSAGNVRFLEGQFGDLIKTGAQILTIGYAFSKTKDLIINATDAYGKFDDSLRKTGAKIGATEQELRLLGDSTKKVALEMNSTAVAVSDAQEFLALAGYTLEEIQAASPTVVAAQKATGESMQLVSDIATDTASSYGYMADELDYVTDRMVYTTNKFNTNFAQLGEAMKYVAPIAKQTEMEFSDLNSYLGVLANSGIKGSQAGTALRQTFLRLQAPTGIASKLLKRYRVDLFNTKGEFIGVNESMLKIEKATKKMTEQQKAFFLQQLFGTEAMSSINILFKEGIENVIEYGNSIDMADGKTREMANFMEAGFGGMKRSLESQKDGIMVVLGEIFEPVAWDFVKILRDGAAEVRESLEEDKSNISLAASGLWSYTKKAGELVGDFIYNTGEILDFATGGIFTAAPEAVVGGTANALINEGKEAQGLQNFEKKKIQIEGSDSLMSMNEAELQNYLYKMYGNNDNSTLMLPDINKILKGTDFENISQDKEINVNTPVDSSSKLTLEFDFKNLNGIFDNEEYRQGIQELTLKTLGKQFGKVRNSY